jgi:hypothetical protein
MSEGQQAQELALSDIPQEDGNATLPEKSGLVAFAPSNPATARTSQGKRHGTGLESSRKLGLDGV